MSVSQPHEKELHLNTHWDVYNYLLAEFETIKTFRDEASKEIGLSVGLLGACLLR